MASRSASLALIAMLAAGCTQILGLDGEFKTTTTGTGSGAAGATGSTSNTTAQTSSGTGGAGTRTVTGTEAITYVHFGGGGMTTDVVHPDLTNVSIAAFVPEAGGLGLPIAGVGALNGTFTIPNVPVGSYYLLIRDSNYDNSYYVTSADDVDMSYYAFGRPDAQPATSTTPLKLDVSNLQSWLSADRLELISAGANAVGLDLTANAVSGIPAGGATTLALTIDSSKLVSPNLIDGSAGDLAGIMQLTPQSSPVNYQAITRYGVLTPFTQTNAVALTASGAFTDVGPTLDAPIVWNTTAFEALAPAVNPTATVISHQFKVQTELGSPSYGIYGLTPDLVTYAPAVGGGSVNNTLTFGNPLPAAWYLYDTTVTTFGVVQNTPGGTPSTTTVNSADVAPKSAFESAEPVTPRISPPKTPTLDGTDFFANATLTTDTPMIAWAPPDTGLPTSYLVRIFNLAATGKKTLVGTIVTSDTSARCPQGILMSGSYYVFTVRSTLLSGVDYEKTPSLEPLPLATATILSGVQAAP